MTCDRNRDVAHLVADSLDEARSPWIDVFNRDRAQIGPVQRRRGRRKP